MSLTRTRTWVAGTVVVALLLSVAAWFLLLSPARAEAALLQQQQMDVASGNDALQVRIDELAAQFADLDDERARLAAVQQAVPEEAGIPDLYRDLDALANASGVTLEAVTPGTATLVEDPAAAAATTATDGTATTDGTTAVAAGTAVAADTGSVLISIPVSVSYSGDFFASEDYLRRLQTELDRALLVTGLTITARTDTADPGTVAAADGSVTVNVTGSVFVYRPAETAATATTGTGTTGTTVDPTSVATN